MEFWRPISTLFLNARHAVCCPPLEDEMYSTINAAAEAIVAAMPDRSIETSSVP